jgi:hypothetical protein
MRSLIVLAVLIAATGCTTVHEKTLQYCDKEGRQFIGIPIYSTADCISVSNSEAGREIHTPTLP